MPPLLTLVTFTPLVGLVILLFIRGQRLGAIRAVGILFSLLPFLISIAIFMGYEPTTPGFQMEENVPWISLPGVEICYHMGVDGVSVPMVLLTGLLGFVAAIASWGIRDRAKEYWVFYLLLQVGMFGTFVSLDLFLFYIFWELVLVPMYFLIGIWGGPRREYAAIKFFLYTLAGSVFMLIAFLFLYVKLGTFQIPELIEGARTLTLGVQTALFIALFLGFAIKVPVWPFHTWLPDAHVEAPTPISVILAGVLLKMGTYGFFRFSFPLCPDAVQQGWLMFALGTLGVVGIIYAAFVAFAQTDFKKLVAYSSVSHMGFVLLGLSGMTIAGFSGAYFQTFSHGILSGAMFLIVGVIYDRAHTRDMDAFGGLLTRVPVYGGILIFFALGSLGLPGLSGFIAEFFVLFGAFKLQPWLVVAAGVGVVMTAAYILTMIRRILLGPLNERWAELPEINTREMWTLIPLGVVTLAIGLWPRFLMDTTDPTLQGILNEVAPAHIETGLPNHEEILAGYGIDMEQVRRAAESEHGMPHDTDALGTENHSAAPQDSPH
ncbi:NADH-quinone oxidoreductase subunit M [Candidatus Sumerlaeota bacterium]|nr:NADH-quinone oxidoreductase subunit M [Candidatus Sumerlaeota bacterium]